MPVLKNTHSGKPVILLDGFILCGCKIFTIDQLSEIIIKYVPSLKLIEEVVHTYTGNKTSIEEFMSLATHKFRDIRETIARYPNLPLESFEVLSQDPHPWVRQNIARNQHTPKEILDSLVKDANSFVRFSTEDTLDGLTVT